jgi:hypothetical protein
MTTGEVSYRKRSNLSTNERRIGSPLREHLKSTGAQPEFAGVCENNEREEELRSRRFSP